MRILSAGLFYIFCDEKPLDLNGRRRLITGYIVVPQDSWNRLGPERRELKEPKNLPRLKRVQTLLENTDGVALIAYADLKRELLQKGERDGTDDIPDMSRSDNAWSATMAYGLAALFGWLKKNGLCVQTADLYHDMRILKTEHCDALRRVVTQTLPEIIRETERQSFSFCEFQPKVRRFKYVGKPHDDVMPDKFQAGVNVAHHLLQNVRDFINQPQRGPIHVQNISVEVIRFLENFQAGFLPTIEER